MNNSTNIYDVDNQIIRKAGDNHTWTVEEVKNKLEYYRNKLKDLAEDDKKAVIYATYMRNLSNYLLVLYSKMTPEQLNAEIELAKKVTTEEQVKKAMEELKNSVETEENEGLREANTTTEIQGGTNTEDNKSNNDEELGNDQVVGREHSNISEERPVTQDDLLVEREVTPDNMDEYVVFEEPYGESTTDKQLMS